MDWLFCSPKQPYAVQTGQPQMETVEQTAEKGDILILDMHLHR